MDSSGENLETTVSEPDKTNEEMVISVDAGTEETINGNRKGLQNC